MSSSQVLTPFTSTTCDYIANKKDDKDFTEELNRLHPDDERIPSLTIQRAFRLSKERLIRALDSSEATLLRLPFPPFVAWIFVLLLQFLVTLFILGLNRLVFQAERRPGHGIIFPHEQLSGLKEIQDLFENDD